MLWSDYKSFEFSDDSTICVISKFFLGSSNCSSASSTGISHRHIFNHNQSVVPINNDIESTRINSNSQVVNFQYPYKASYNSIDNNGTMGTVLSFSPRPEKTSVSQTIGLNAVHNYGGVSEYMKENVIIHNCRINLLIQA